MYYTRILLSIVFVLFASTALAAKPEKTLVCHVGNNYGPDGQVYDPYCVPDESYDCSADAGKVDLISVSKKAKHIGNDSHSFLDADDYLWEDYAPEDGVGDDPADFEEGDVAGIDRGCELAEDKLLCDCWNGYTQADLIARFEAAPLFTYGPPSCFTDVGVSYVANDELAPEFNLQYYAGSCTFRAINPFEGITVSAANDGSDVCLTELTTIIPLITWCQLD